MNRVRTFFLHPVPAGLILLLAFLLSGTAGASGEEGCLDCHGDLAAGPVKHQALSLGCTVCHGAIDPSSIPHRNMSAVARGLSAEQPQLCYECHDKSDFTRKSVHPALLMGCTTCHNVHSSKNAKLLNTALPDLCFTCHDRSGFAKKYRHGPAEAGMCTGCHAPHSSNEKPALLRKKPVEVCLSCHRNISEERHVVAGFPGGGHPIGLQRKGSKRKLRDPLRPGKPFYCGSCHDPHSSDTRYMIRFAAASPLDICAYCHKKESGTPHIP